MDSPEFCDANAGKTVLMISVKMLKGNISSQSLGNG